MNYLNHHNPAVRILLFVGLVVGIPGAVMGILVLMRCDCEKYEFHPVTQRQMKRQRVKMRKTAAPKPASTACKKWAYKTVARDELEKGDLAGNLNKLGEEGWERISGAPEGKVLFKKCVTNP